MSNPEFLTSTGNLGLERRSYNRWYLNWGLGSVKSEFLIRQYQRARLIIKDNPDARCVARLIMSSEALMDISDPKIQACIEAVIPLYKYPENWMVMVGINGRNRLSSLSIDEAVRQTENLLSKQSPEERVKAVLNEGFVFFDNFNPTWLEQIYMLWADTFGWDKEKHEVENLLFRLNCDMTKAPRDRNIWMSGLIDPLRRQIVSLAMAEKLLMPIIGENSLSIVESTEWVTHPDYLRNGYMAANISFLTAQVMRDLRDTDPLIIAETNFQSQAFRAGVASGLSVPPRQIGNLFVPQVLRQNVGIGDGNGTGLRDFIMMYLSRPDQQKYYSPAQIKNIL